MQDLQNRYFDVKENASFVGIIPLNNEILVNMLISSNPSVEKNFVSELAELYIEWGRRFDIRADFAWSQMCLETQFLKNFAIVRAGNNFCGLSFTEGNIRKKYSFETVEKGVIAHYAHLAWYLFSEHVNDYCNISYDPKHNTINGSEHNNIGYKLNCLNEKWNPSKDYCKKIVAYTTKIYDLSVEGRNSDKAVSTLNKIKNNVIDLVNLKLGVKRWEYIAIHHSATNDGSVDSFRKYHIENNKWRDIGYHFVICNGNGGPDGEIQLGRSIDMRGAHGGSEYNGKSIGICLVGWFDNVIWVHTDSSRKFENPGNKIPTNKQMESLNKLVIDLTQEYEIPAYKIIGHREIPEFKGKKSCPGNNFDLDRYRELIESQLN